MKPILLLFLLALYCTVHAQKPNKHLANCDTTFMRSDTSVCQKKYGKRSVLLKYVKDGELLFSKRFKKEKNGDLYIETLKKGYNSRNHGEAVLLWPNGKIKARTWFTEGKQDGPSLSYYEDGKRQCVCRYKNGKRDGEQYVFFQNGQLQMNDIWKEGRLMEVKSRFDEQGNPLEIGTLKDGNGYLIIIDESGRKTGFVTLEDGKPTRKKVQKFPDQ